MSYSDYPQAATNNAKRALKHREDNGTYCGTQVGWERANQLASREALSLETVKRTFSFLSRAKTYDQGDFTDSDGNEICGSVMYAAWGGDEMATWAERTIDREEKSRNLLATVETRHIKEVVETEDSYIVEFMKPEMETSGDKEKYRAEPDELSVGDFVSWRSGEGRAQGRITQVERDGMVTADSDFEVNGAEDDPAALIAIYDEVDEGFVEREPQLLVAHRFSRLTKEDSGQFRAKNSTQMKALRKNTPPVPGDNSGPAVERRTYASSLEVRMVEDKGEEIPVIRGYALKFDEESEDLGGFTEIIDRKALENTDMSDVRALFNHDPNFVLGRTTNGTLKLEIDDVGLRYEITPSDSQIIRDLVYTPIKRGDVNQSSFGFIVTSEDSEWERRDEGPWKRTITNIRELFDVSPVTFPAYRQTEATARSLEAAKQAVERDKDAEGRQKRMDAKYMETFNR